MCKMLNTILASVKHIWICLRLSFHQPTGLHLISLSLHPLLNYLFILFILPHIQHKNKVRAMVKSRERTISIRKKTSKKFL